MPSLTYEQLKQEVYQLEAKYRGVERVLRELVGETALGSSAWDVLARNLSVSGGFTGPKAMLTQEGGFAISLTNNTGEVSAKGTLVHASESMDCAADAANLAGFDTIGVVYNSGVAEGDEVWVVTNGIAEVLLEDGTASTHGAWVRSSGVQQGRANAESSAIPGETPASDITLTRGSIGAGTLAATDVADNTYLQLNSATSAAHFDIVFDFTLESAPEDISITGWFNSEDSDELTLEAYNFVSMGWDTIATMVDSTAASLTYASLGSPYYDADNNLTQIRFYQNTGGDNGRIYIDHMVVSTSSATHFKEIGHCLESKDSGVDVLAKVALHFN